MLLFILCSIQVVAIIILLFVTHRVFTQKHLSNWRYMVVTGILCVVYSTGYLLEVSCKELASARICLDFEYMGLVFLPLVYFLLICGYCNYKVSERLRNFLFVFGLLIEVLVITNENHKLYYTSVEFFDDGLFPHLEMQHGLFYYLFIVEQFTLFIWAAVLIWKRAQVEKNVKKKRLFMYMFVVSVMPMVAIFFNLSNAFREYDIGPVACNIMLDVLIMLMLNSYMTDVVGMSVNNLYHNLGNGIIIVDNEGRFLDCNFVASNIFTELQACSIGTEIESLGISLLDEIEEQFFEKDGLYYSAFAGRIFNKGVHVGYIISIVDVTQMRNQINEMTALRDAANDANLAKSKFLATMSHEIRTPLNAIIGMATVSQMETDAETIQNNIYQIKSAGGMLLDIVSEVLDISKAESGKLEIVPVEYSVRELFEGVINVTNMRIGDKPIRFLIDIDPKIPQKLIGDDVRIRQVLMNFLSNAEKYTDEGSITLKVDFEKANNEAGISGINMKCAVIDTGRGVKETDISKLFTPFTQVDTKDNRQIMGTGLGLAIVAKLVELMGGHYFVESEYKKGSTFGFTVFQEISNDNYLDEEAKREVLEVTEYSSFSLYSTKKNDEKQNINKDKSEDKDSVKGPDMSDIDITKFEKARVLIVDDNKVNLTVLTSFLKKFGIKPDKAMSGHEVIELFKEKEYDLVFMDHMMPEMDGVETTVYLRENGSENAKNVPIIACTANVIKEAQVDFKEAGMNDFLAKPIIFEQLRDKLIKYLN